jgi:hypothetical protein
MDEYWRLSHEFPLAPIRDDAHLEQALAIIMKFLSASQ